MTGPLIIRRQGVAPAVAVGGRPVEVDLALTQDAARTLAVSKAAFVGASDNRNLYLVWLLRVPLSRGWRFRPLPPGEMFIRTVWWALR